MNAVRATSAKTASRTSRPRPLTVALVGPDGAGKSTVTALLEQAGLPRPVKRIYMGLNLESSSLMLPTTRLLMAARRNRGGRAEDPSAELSEGTAPGWRRAARDSARLTAWMAEEWLRFLVAAGYGRRGYIVVFDRHFFLDYYHADIRQGPRPGHSLFHRLHAWMLEHAYPKPELVVCLDAPGQVLFARKGEGSPEWLEGRREEYRALADVVPAFVVVDAGQPVEAVVEEVAQAIGDYWATRTDSAG